MTAKTMFLDRAEWLEFAPVVWHPQTGDEKLAGLIGYNTGDGSVHISKPRFTKKDGAVSTYTKLQSAFYSHIETDLHSILGDCQALGMGWGVSVRLKKAKADATNGYQFQLGANDTRALIDAGAPVGRKVVSDFEVPEWVRAGSPTIKRAYLAALFGAEGSSPARDASSRSRLPRNPTLSMCKTGNANGSRYFEQLKALLGDLGVQAEVTVTGVDYRSHWLRVRNDIDNLIRFFEEIGFLHCNAKAVLAWQWSKYLRAYRAEAARRRETALKLRDESQTYTTIGKALGITRGAAHRLLSDIDAGKGVTAGHAFPHFDVWLAERWSEKRRLLRLGVVSRTLRPKPQGVWNMLVSSPDHSYLLGSGANNFNSFETMSGRVYHTFDRRKHVKECPFNPKLPIWVGQDFNIDPMSSVIMQPQPNGTVWIIDEAIIPASNTQETAEELQRRYFRHQKQMTLYPDPAGSSRSHGRGESDLDILREAGFTRIKFRRKHPRVADRVNAVNRMFESAEGTIRLYIDPKCRKTIESLEQTVYKEGSSEVDKSLSTEHAADALGYCIEFEFPLRKVQVGGRSL